MADNEGRVGRRTLSPEGRRIVVNLTLSPEAIRAAKRLCERPIAAVPLSTMVEHLIMQAWGVQNGDILP